MVRCTAGVVWSEIRSQKSEVRGQKSEVRDQRSEVRGQRSEVRQAARVSKVDVSIPRDGGATWQLLADDLDAALGTLQVKAKKPKSETVIIRVTDSSNAAVFGQSGMFNIR
jgi:hypothetical protein